MRVDESCDESRQKRFSMEVVDQIGKGIGRLLEETERMRLEKFIQSLGMA